VRRDTDKEARMGDWQLDPYHTQVEFSAKHLGMMTVRGHFADVSATGDIDPDHPESSSVDVVIRTDSIRTNHEARDNDLRSSNFLEAEQFPIITFKSTSVAPAGQDAYAVTGDLTIKDNTRPVVLQLRKYGEFNDPMMGHRIAYGATAQINRKDFGLTFNMVLDGRFVVSDEIQITIEGELVEKQQEAAAAAG
jgi:polyisoprenoid-binding protein YceI